MLVRVVARVTVAVVVMVLDVVLVLLDVAEDEHVPQPYGHFLNTSLVASLHSVLSICNLNISVQMSASLMPLHQPLELVVVCELVVVVVVIVLLDVVEDERIATCMV